MNRIFLRTAVTAAGLGAALVLLAQGRHEFNWKHLSSATGDLETPNSKGTEQCSAAVFDIDGDGVNDFVITERTSTPSVVWYRRSAAGWKRYVIDNTPLHVEAGATFYDVDGDGHPDFVGASDDRGNEIWWWQNPAPQFDPDVAWKRHVIKNTGGRKHHDILFGDFDGDGRQELAFWNQGSHGLFLARIPPDPRNAGPWPYTKIYGYSTDSESEQRGLPEPFKGINEHEGLTAIDIDGDGVLDIVGGGRWFKHVKGDTFSENIIDASYPFSRAGAGRFIRDSPRPQVVFVVGDGKGPAMFYRWEKGTWKSRKLLDVDSGHSLQVMDFDGDGNLDIFIAEMSLNGRDPNPHVYLLFGDGQGNFETTVPVQGVGLHESKVADLDGNGTLDILGKPYNWRTPRLDIWLNMGRK